MPVDFHPKKRPIRLGKCNKCGGDVYGTPSKSYPPKPPVHKQCRKKR